MHACNSSYPLNCKGYFPLALPGKSGLVLYPMLLYTAPLAARMLLVHAILVCSATILSGS